MGFILFKLLRFEMVSCRPDYVHKDDFEFLVLLLSPPGYWIIGESFLIQFYLVLRWNPGLKYAMHALYQQPRLQYITFDVLD